MLELLFSTSVYIGEKRDSFVGRIASESKREIEVLDDGFSLSIIRETIGKI